MLLGDGMPRAYSSDLRIRVIRAVEDGSSARGAARRLGVGESTATAWVGRWRRTGSAAAKSQKGRSRSPLNRHAAWLLGLIGERADLTLTEIRDLLGERGIRIGVSSIWRFFEAAGAILLYLPPYSPDLNPIEMLFAKLKALLRQAAERTIPSLWAAIGRLLDDFPADECARYLAHAGYASI